MRCHNLDSVRAGLCPRGGETALDDFLVRHNFPIPVAGRPVAGDPIRKCAFLSHEDESRRSGLILPKSFPGMSISVPSDCSLRGVPTNPVQRSGLSEALTRSALGGLEVAGKSCSFARPAISRLRRVILPNPLRPRVCRCRRSCRPVIREKSQFRAQHDSLSLSPHS
jgi:hypothetical protein